MTSGQVNMINRFLLVRIVHPDSFSAVHDKFKKYHPVI